MNWKSIIEISTLNVLWLIARMIWMWFKIDASTRLCLRLHIGVVQRWVQFKRRGKTCMTRNVIVLHCNIVWDETFFEINELTLLLFFRFPTSCHKYSSIKPVNLLYSLQQRKKKNIERRNTIDFAPSTRKLRHNANSWLCYVLCLCLSLPVNNNTISLLY